MLRLPLLVVVCGLQLTAAVHTHIEYFSAPATRGHENECQDNKAGKLAKLGETWTTSGCKLATCVMREDYRGMMLPSITEDGCPILEPKPGCRRTAVSRTKKYPDCCPKLRCRSTTGGKVVIISGGSPAPSASSSSASSSVSSPSVPRSPPRSSSSTGSSRRKSSQTSSTSRKTSQTGSTSRKTSQTSSTSRKSSQTSSASRRKYPKYQPRS